MGNISATISEIKKGKNLKENLTIFADEAAKLYRDYAVLNLIMNYADCIGILKKSGATSSYSDNLKKLTDMLEKLPLTTKRFEDDILEIESILENIKNRADVLSAYISDFEIFEYAAGRKLPSDKDFGYTDSDEAAKEILGNIFKTDDNVLINLGIQETVKQLPVRYTRDKFKEIVGNAIEKYQGDEKKSLEGFIYFLRSEGMLLKSDFKKELYQTLWDRLDYFKSVKLENAEYELLDELYDEILECSKECERLFDEEFMLVGAFNSLYLLILTLKYTDMSELKRETDTIERLKELYADTEFSGEDYETELEKLLAGLEIKLEDINGRKDKYEAVVSYINEQYSEKLSETGLCERYDILEKCSRMKDVNTFIDLKNENEGKVVSKEDIEKAKTELFKDLDKIFDEVCKSVRKAIMANLLSNLPVFFENRTEVMEYVRTSLASCTDRNEFNRIIGFLREFYD